MEKINLKCNSCGSRKFIKSGENFYECKYCGSIIRIKSDEEDLKSNSILEPEVETKSDKQQNGIAKKETNTSKDYSPLMPIVIKMIVCLFVGVFGVHKFIEGKVILGIVYLFTFGIFGIGPVIDFIVYIIELSKKYIDINEG